MNLKSIQKLIDNRILFLNCYIFGKIVFDGIKSLGLDITMLFYCFIYLWGLYFIVSDIFLKRIEINKIQLLLLVFTGIAIVSYLINYQAFRIGAISRFITLLTMVYVFFSIPFKNENYIESFERMSKKYVIFIMIICILSLFLYICSNIHNVGEGRLYGLTTHPNILATLCYLSVGLCIYLFEEKYISIYIFTVSNLLTIITLSLTFSRSGTISIIFIILFYIYTKLKNHNFYKLGIVLSILLSGFVLYASMSYVIPSGVEHLCKSVGIRQSCKLGREFDVYNPKNNSNLSIIYVDRDLLRIENDNIKDDSAILELDVIKYDDINEYNVKDVYDIINKVSSTRLDIWITSFITFLKKPLLGYGWQNHNYAFTIAYNVGNSHNIVLNLLLWTGIIGTSLFIYIIYKMGKLYFYNKNNLKIKNLNYLFILAVSILIYSFFEQAIIGNMFVVTVYFWIVLGIITSECINNNRL